MTRYTLSVIRDVRELGIDAIVAMHGSVTAYMMDVWFLPAEQARLALDALGLL